jgi:hypothetical protein
VLFEPLDGGLDKLGLAHLFMVHPAGVPTRAASARSPRWGRFCAAQPRPQAKAAKVSLDGSRLRGGVLRRAVLERSRACLAIGRTASMRRPVRRQCVGPTIPDSIGCVTSDDADQASVAVL